MSLALTRLATSPKSQLIIEEGAVDDQDEFQDQIANPAWRHAFVPNGFVAGGRFMKLDPPSFALIERELIVLADQGVNEMGRSQRD